MSESILPLAAIDGPFLVGALVLGVAFIVVATTRFRMHPFLALILTAYGMGLCGGLSPAQTIASLTGGFGKTLGYIGIVISCGCIIGMVLEKSGGALVLAEAMLKLIGRSRAVLAMSCTGVLVSIPVYCDSGYVVLSPLARSLARRTGLSMGAFAVALSMGLYATHCLVPPTPGPIATAGELRADIGTVLWLGLLVVVPVLAATYAYAQFIGRRIFIDPNQPRQQTSGEAAAIEPEPTFGAFAALLPILLPILLIAIRSIADLPSRPLGEGSLRTGLGLVGDPNTALILGIFLAWWVVRDRGLATFGDWCSDGLRDGGTIILVTAAGGALGGVLRATPLATMVGDSLTSFDLGRFSLVLPFVVAVGLKTSIGSSTVAMITTASLVSQLLPAMGLATGFGPALATLAIASGAMVVSHANDSYFWVITQMSGMTVSQGYRLITVATAVAGFTSMGTILLLSLVLL